MIRASWTDLRKLRNMVFSILDGNSYQGLHKAHVRTTVQNASSVNFTTTSKEYDCIHDGVSIEVVPSVPSFDDCLAACDTHNADPLSTSICTHVRYTPSTAGIVLLGGGAQARDSCIAKSDKIIRTGSTSGLRMTHCDILKRQMTANFLKIQLI